MFKESDRAAGELLLKMMTEAGCSATAIEVIGFAVDGRPLNVAVDRAGFWFQLVGKEAPTLEWLRKQASS